MKRVLRGLAACLSFFCASAGSGQSSEKSATDPHSSQGKEPEFVRVFAGGFASAFADYRRFDPDQPLVDWRAANDEVKSAGGHVGLMRAQSVRSEPPRSEQKSVTPPAKRHH